MCGCYYLIVDCFFRIYNSGGENFSLSFYRSNYKNSVSRSALLFALILTRNGPSPELKEKGKKKGTKRESKAAEALLLVVVILPRTSAPRYEQGKPVEGFKAARGVQRSTVREVFRSGVRVRKSISYLRGSVVVAYEVTCYYRRFAASL